MDYQATLKYLYESAPMFQQVGSKAYKEGLENSLELDNYFGHPHHTFRSIHIGGTNGKGSCSHTLAAILQAAGYKVGLYTSPHLIDFRERIRVNGEMMPEEYVIRFVEEHRSFFEPLYPSFFELTTAMAFKYFRDQKIDIAVIEVGMGGRLDCTNIINPILSIITNISYDHTQFLGNTLEKIAREKAGIIKQNVPVIIGRTNGHTKRVFTQKANTMNAPILFAKETDRYISYVGNVGQLKIEKQETDSFLEDKNVPLNTIFAKKQSFYIHPDTKRNRIAYMDYWIKKNQNYRVYEVEIEDGFLEIYGELTGNCQAENGRTIFSAITVLNRLGYQITKKNIESGFGEVCKMTGLMGRWQQLQSNPTLICDTGHNIDGISIIVEQLQSLKKQNDFQNLHIIFGMVNDKDISGVLKLLPKDATYYFTQASVQRALPVNDLMKQASKAGLEGNSYSTVVEALQAAQEKSLPEDLIFAGGSSFIVADLLSNRHTLNLD